MTEIIIWLYAGNIVVSSAAFVPQVIALVKATGPARSTSLLAWCTWLYTGFIWFLYAVAITGDKLLMLGATFNLVLTFSVVALILYNRYVRFGQSGAIAT
jgi:hypothetical protein